MREFSMSKRFLFAVFAIGLPIAAGAQPAPSPNDYGDPKSWLCRPGQHDACDVSSDWNHSRNFVGRAFNWIMCNNGYHTIHHNRAGLHWTELARAHEKEVAPKIDPALDEPSMLVYLLRTYGLRFGRPARREVTRADQREVTLATREQMRAEVESGAV